MTRPPRVRPRSRRPRATTNPAAAYCFAPDPVIDTRIQVYELWDDAPTLAAHFLHENYFNMRDFLRGSGMTGAENRKYRVDADAPVYNADHVATVDF